MADGVEKDAQAEEMEAGSETVVEESVSFGRFTGESLSWDRWSSFSQNKYMEEAEKCSTPGSVAEKKAYFEAHYKKVAAQKAELLEQEKHAEVNSFKSDKPKFGDAADNGWNSEHRDGKGGQVDAENGDGTKGINSDGDDIESNAAGIEDELTQETVIGETEGPSKKGGAREEEEMPNNNLELEKLKVDASVEEEKHFPEPELLTDLPIEQPTQDQRDPETNQASQEPEKAAKHMLPSKQSQKKTPTQPVEKNTATIKKKAEMSTPKSRNTTITRVPRASPASPISSAAAKASIRKDNTNSTTRPKSRNASVTENKRPTSTLHSSLVISSNVSDSVATTTPRRSLIMEKMGEKEIVRRAFKAFQKRISPSDYSEDANSSSTLQVSANGKQQNSPAPATPTRRDEGMETNDRDRKVAEKPNTQRRPVDSRVPSVSTRVIGVKERFNEAPVGAGFRSSMRQSHGKDAMNAELGIVVHQSNGPQAHKEKREVERIRLSSTPSAVKGTGIKKLRQGLNFKATPMPESFREGGASVNNVNKRVRLTDESLDVCGQKCRLALKYLSGQICRKNDSPFTIQVTVRRQTESDGMGSLCIWWAFMLYAPFAFPSQKGSRWRNDPVLYVNGERFIRRVLGKATICLPSAPSVNEHGIRFRKWMEAGPPPQDTAV
ncbi:hypothetical protein ACLOJK_030962 [Asimina triloba]